MIQNKNKDLERDLLGSLLDDEQQTSAKAHKNGENSKRMQAFSAPPVFLDFDLKMNFDALDEYNFDSPDPEDRNITKAFCSKQSTHENNFHTFSPPSGFRKMSVDSGLMAYYENHENTNFDYFQYSSMITPEQELLNNVHKAVEWACDQNGSRAVQNIFEGENTEKQDAIFNNLIQQANSLMKDRFGNYVFQRIFEKGSTQHKQILLCSIWGDVVQLSMHAYGCRVIQKLIQFIADRKQKQIRFIEEIINDGLVLMQNQNGNHVIQKCIQLFPHEIIEPLADIMISKLKQLPFDSYGCRVVQKYLENHRGNDKCEFVLKQLLKQAVSLSQCQFGNYVMQHIVTKCEIERKEVFQRFLENIYELSINKYASNVIEKAIQAHNSDFCQLLSEWLLNHQKLIIQLSKHQYGNYVIQSMFQRVSKDKKLAIKNILKENAVEISKSQHGRHVLMQLEKNRAR